MTRRPAGAAGRAPVGVVLAQVLMGGVAAGHLLVVVLTLAQQPLLAQRLGAADGAAVGVVRSIGGVTRLALAVHVPLLLLTAVLAVTLGGGRPWARRPATVSQVFAVAFSGLSTPPLPLLEPVVPAAVAAALLLLGLLWLPAGSRAFFAARTRSRVSRPRGGRRGAVR